MADANLRPASAGLETTGYRLEPYIAALEQFNRSLICPQNTSGKL
jgi:hypothetical protein